MGGGGFSSSSYTAAVDALRSTGTTFARSVSSHASGRYDQIADILDPRKLKDGKRECCFAAGFNDAMPIVVSIDCTGSMEDVPKSIQQELPELINMLTEQEITDHPSILFMAHDDEHSVPNATFQMSQFESGDKELINALNEMIIPGQGGGNSGEAYHLSIYAAAFHTRLECFERDGTKGVFVLIGDEPPYYDNQDPAHYGTSPEIAYSVFGDRLQAERTMLESLQELVKKYHVFVVRPKHTSHGENMQIGKKWQDLLRAAGENPQHVLHIKDTNAIVPIIAMCIGRLFGVEEDTLVDVLQSKRPEYILESAQATRDIMPVNSIVAQSATSSTIATGSDRSKGRKRNKKPV